MHNFFWITLYKLWCLRGIRQNLEEHPLNYHYQQENCVHTSLTPYFTLLTRFYSTNYLGVAVEGVVILITYAVTSFDWCAFACANTGKARKDRSQRLEDYLSSCYNRRKYRQYHVGYNLHVKQNERNKFCKIYLKLLDQMSSIRDFFLPVTFFHVTFFPCFFIDMFFFDIFFLDIFFFGIFFFAIFFFDMLFLACPF